MTDATKTERKATKWTQIRIRALSPGRYAIGDGLYFVHKPDGSRFWTFRFQWHGRSREASIGKWSFDGKDGHRTLEDAKTDAAALRRQIKSGIDPIAERRKDRAPLATFGQFADEWYNARKAGFSVSYRFAWSRTIYKTLKALHPIPLKDLTKQDVLAVLKPLCLAKPKEGKHVQTKLEAILQSAVAEHDLPGNVATWRGNLKQILVFGAKNEGLSTVRHHAAMKADAIPSFIASIHGKGMAALAVEFIALSAVRTHEARFATWGEIDMERRLWTVPTSRLKTRKSNRNNAGFIVPLTARMVEILQEAAQFRTPGNDFIFRSMHGGKGALGVHSMLNLLDGTGATLHGFRASFRQWAHDNDVAEFAVIEERLGHAIGSQATRAYLRGVAVEKGRTLLEAWGRHCLGLEAAGNIVPIRKVAV